MIRYLPDEEGPPLYSGQLEFDFDRLSPADLRAMLRGGLVVESGATPSGKVRSYRLTAAGRILLQNQLNRPEDNFPTARR